MVVSAQILSLHCCLLFVAVFFIRDSNFVALEFRTILHQKSKFKSLPRAIWLLETC